MAAPQPTKQQLAQDNNNDDGPASSNTTIAGTDDQPATGAPAKKGFKFVMIIISLLVVSTALPTIAADLKSQDFSWIGNAYSIASVAVIPWSGGLANVFGRRPVLLGGLGFFFVGSVLCGAAKNINTMLVGRTFQGVGSGVILTLVEIVLADLVPLSERGAYQGAFGATWALASAAGPPIGGGLASAYWPALFYLNLPLTLLVVVVVMLFVNLKTPEGTIREKLGRMDWIGNAVFIPSITLFTIGLAWGGANYPWSDAHVLATLIIGFVGLVAWIFVEYRAEYPTVPFKLLHNWTTLIGFFTTFLHGIAALAVFYYLPAYFQSTHLMSPVRASVAIFTTTFIVAPFAMVAGGTISATQVYKPQNIVAWVFMTFGPGLLMLLNENSDKAHYTGLQVPFAIGLGLLYAATTFPVLAPLPPSLAGPALAFLVFIRSFGNLFGITIGSVVLTNELGKYAPQEWLAQIPGGVAGAYSQITEIKMLAEPLRDEVRKAFSQSLRVLWIVLIPFGGVGLIVSLFMKSLPLDTVTDEQWGMKEKPKNKEELSMA
ncbi:major facilitator superfamily protein [Pseudohyphozyma bogoriensis]|nr:major facilitator superfamily protein [Pseudohyphozyma bogoriensis]